jgi:hypothetical protein
MDTLGELCDKITILDIRLEHHPDGGARAELDEQRVLLHSEAEQVWEHGGKGRAVLKHKLRTTAAGEVSGGCIEELQSELRRINRAAWENEDARDAEMKQILKYNRIAHVPRRTLLALARLDVREQRLNQTRNAIIDAINRKGLEKWANASQ